MIELSVCGKEMLHHMKARRTPGLIILAIMLCIALWPGHVALGEQEQNLLTNGGFEELDESGQPVGWTQDMYVWDAGVSVFEVSEQGAYDGQNCVSISSGSANDARYAQTVPCERSSIYRLSGWVRAEGVPEGTTGVNLSVENSFISTTPVTGTSDEWTYVEVYGLTGAEQTELTVYARLGFYSDTLSGRAYFDDLSLTKVDTVPDGALFGLFYIDQAETADDTAVETTHDYTSAIVITALAFAAIVLILMYLRGRNRLPVLAGPANERAVLMSMLTVAFIARLVIGAIVPGYSNDIACWLGWGTNMLEYGPWNFYANSGFCDYPPGYMYVLALVAGLRNLVRAEYSSALSQVLVKLPAMLCDLASAMLLYKWAKREKIAGGMAMWLAALYVLNPATIFDSAAWGQIDSVFTLMVVAAVYLCVSGKWAIALPLYLVSALVKPQTLMLAPIALVVLIVEIAREKDKPKLLKQVGIGLAAAVAAAAVIVVPFWGGQSWDWLIGKYTETLSSYNYATVNAMNLYILFNLNWVDASYVLLGLPVTVWSYIFMAISIAYCAVLYVKARDRRVMPLVCALLLMLLFTFMSKMHERYAFPAIMLLILGYVLLRDRRLLGAAAWLSATQLINMGLVLQSTHLQSSQQVLNFVVALGNVVLAVYLAACAWDICVRGHCREFGMTANSGATLRQLRLDLVHVDPRKNMEQRIAGKSDYKLGMKALDWAVLGAITVCYAVVAFTNLGTLSAPQTEWTSSAAGETVTIDLGQERTFDFTYYGGITSSTFTVEFSSDGVTWTEPALADYDAGNIFQWFYYREHMRDSEGKLVALVSGYPKHTARYIRLTFEAAGFKMREIGFLDENGECYPIESITSANYSPGYYDDPAKMIDEQDTVPAEPSYYNSMYFDEIYHARTAYEHLHGLHTYEWTHPPLGKVLMMIGIAIFGMCPFGWRFMGTLIGVLMVPAMYLLTKQLFKRRDLAIFTTVLMTFDFMHFTQTRIATIDSFGVFFIMLMYLFMFRYMQMSFFRDGIRRTLIPLGLSGLFMGIGCASKWIDIYAAGGLAVLFFATMYMRFNEYVCVRRRLKGEKHARPELQPYIVVRDTFVKNLVITLACCCVFFIAVPALIYYFSYYWQLKPDGGLSLQGVIDVQKNMFNYHSGLTNDTHPFRAEWYTWPLILKPMYYYSGRDFMPSGTYSIIWAMGNPAVWWTMLAGMIFTMVVCWKEKLRDRKKLIIIVSFLAQYLPWVLVPRSMYIYHYFASIPFMIMSLCFVIKAFEKAHPRATRGAAIALMAVTVGLFVLFYPVISGAPCSQTQLNIINMLGPWNLY